MGQKTLKESERSTYLLQRLTWDIQGRMRHDCFLTYLVADLINYHVKLYQENCLISETIPSLLFSIVAVSLPQKIVFLAARKGCRSFKACQSS